MTANIGEPSVAKDISSLGFRVRQLERRPLPRKAQFDIKVFADDVVTQSGDGKFIFAFPADLDGLCLVRAEGYVTTSGSDGVLVSIENLTASLDLMDDPIAIDVGELTSYTSVSPSSVEPNLPISTGHMISVNVDDNGTDTQGLGVILDFALCSIY
jgi:hypothetical protein